MPYPKCVEFGCTYVPLAVETYGNWGRLAPLLAGSHSVPKSKAAADIFDLLNLTLMRSVARAILVRGSKANVIILCIYKLHKIKRNKLSVE